MVSKPHDVFKHINMHSGDSSVCWEWLASLSGTSQRPSFRYMGKTITAYRLVYELFNNVLLERSDYVRHKCDNPICCNPFHLEIGTHQENMEDMKNRERHGLPHHTVKAIKRLLADGESHSSIAAKFGVDPSTVTRINLGKTYKNVGNDPADEPADSHNNDNDKDAE